MLRNAQKYYDYDMEITSKPTQHKIDRVFGQFHVYESGNSLVVELAENTEETRAAFAAEVEYHTERRGYTSAEFDLFAPIFTNGLDYFTVDMIGAMSEAPAFAELVLLPDWLAEIKYKAAIWRENRAKIDAGGESWLLPDYYAIDWERSRVWSAIEYYQIDSPLDHIARTGKAIFKLAE